MECLLNPLGCVEAAVAQVSTETWIIAALFLGLVLGAVFRWGAVALAAFFAFLFLRRNSDDNHTEVSGKDALPHVIVKGRSRGR